LTNKSKQTLILRCSKMMSVRFRLRLYGLRSAEFRWCTDNGELNIKQQVSTPPCLLFHRFLSWDVNRVDKRSSPKLVSDNLGKKTISLPETLGDRSLRPQTQLTLDERHTNGHGMPSRLSRRWQHCETANRHDHPVFLYQQ